MLGKVIKTAAPIMLSYVPVGLACGLLAAQAGMAPWMVALVSVTFFSGSGQFMMSNLWMTGVPVLSIAAGVSAISARFALYSASLAPHLKGASKLETVLASGTLIEEGYGISMGKLVEDDDWGARETVALNIVLILTWTLAAVAGASAGTVIDVPTAIAGFACTSLFIYLLCSQERRRGNIAATIVAFAGVAVLKIAGQASVAVPVAALAGVAAALMLDAVPQKGRQ